MGSLKKGGNFKFPPFFNELLHSLLLGDPRGFPEEDGKEEQANQAGKDQNVGDTFHGISLSKEELDRFGATG
jgi:hypothetical protein